MITFYAQMVILDLEVSDVEEARFAGTYPEIIDVGAIKVDKDLTIIDTYSQLIQPTNLDLVTDQTTRITGITKDHLKDAPLWTQAWEGFGDSRFVFSTSFSIRRATLCRFSFLGNYLWP